MADPVTALDATDEVKTAVRQMIKAAEQAATKNAKEEASNLLDQAKLDFRAGVAGSRRPEQFDPSTMHISTYLENFEPFRVIMNLAGVQAVNTFLTYLNQKSLNTLINQGVVRETNWDNFKRKVIEALSSPREAVQARYELKKAKQRVDETVAEFGERLCQLATLGYKEGEDHAVQSILKDALSGGVLRDEIAIVLINKQDSDFRDCLEEAIKLDSAYRARSTLKEGSDNIQVSVLKNELVNDYDNLKPENSGLTVEPSCTLENQSQCVQPSINHNGAISAAYGIPQGLSHAPSSFNSRKDFIQPSNPHGMAAQRYSEPQFASQQNNLVCYQCNSPGHVSSNCPTRIPPAGYFPRQNFNPQRRNKNLVCHYCGIVGHVIRECRKRIRSEGQRAFGQNQQSQQFLQPGAHPQHGMPGSSQFLYDHNHNTQPQQVSQQVPYPGQGHNGGQYNRTVHANHANQQSAQDARVHAQQYASNWLGNQPTNTNFADNRRQVTGTGNPSSYYGAQATTNSSQVPKN